MNRLILISVNLKDNNLPESFINSALEIREKFTKKSNMLVNIVCSDNKNACLREIMQAYKSYNFNVNNISLNNISGNRKKLIEELHTSMKYFSFTLCLVDFSYEKIKNLIFDLGFTLKSLPKQTSLAGFSYVVVDFN